jgi:group I intron endonuclease
MNLINGKVYIGRARNPEKRWRAHCRISNRPNDKNHQLIHKAIRKYGNSNFLFKVVQELNSHKESKISEQYWITFYQSNVAKYGNDFGYNLTDGGEGLTGYKHNQITKEKISFANSGKLRSLSDKKERSNFSTGKGNPMFGRHHTNESVNRMSLTRKENGTARGANNSKAKLNETQVKEIKLMLKEGKLQQKEIATIYNVRASAIQKIASGKNWDHITI